MIVLLPLQYFMADDFVLHAMQDMQDIATGAKMKEVVVDQWLSVMRPIFQQ